jgi:hypothetical protein
MDDDFISNFTGYRSQTESPPETDIVGPTSERAEPPLPEPEEMDQAEAPGAPEEDGLTAEAPPSPRPTSDEQAEEERLYAEKYRTPDDLEKAYLETTREASRLARETADARRQLDTYQKLMDQMAQASPVKEEPSVPEWPEVSNDDFLENPVGVMQKLIDHRARVEVERADQRARELQYQVQARTQGLRDAFAGVIQRENVPEDQLQNLIGYASSHAGVQRLIEMDAFDDAVAYAHVLWEREHKAPEREQQVQVAKKVRKEAYVEGSRSARQSGYQEPQPPSQEQLSRLSNEELDLLVETKMAEEGRRMPHEMRVSKEK